MDATKIEKRKKEVCGPVALVYNSIASAYFVALKATFPLSLIFSARLATSSSSGGGEGEAGGSGAEEPVGETEVDLLESALIEGSGYGDNEDNTPISITIRGRCHRSWWFRCSGLRCRGSCTKSFFRCCCLFLGHCSPI